MWERTIPYVIKEPLNQIWTQLWVVAEAKGVASGIYVAQAKLTYLRWYVMHSIYLLNLNPAFPPKDFQGGKQQVIKTS